MRIYLFWEIFCEEFHILLIIFLILCFSSTWKNHNFFFVFSDVFLKLLAIWIHVNLGIVNRFRFLVFKCTCCCFMNLLLEKSEVENLNGNRKTSLITRSCQQDTFKHGLSLRTLGNVVWLVTKHWWSLNDACTYVWPQNMYVTFLKSLCTWQGLWMLLIEN
jgi:hypothetical protein